MLSTAGTPSHLPPEMLSSDYGEGVNKGFSNKQDMWALGIMLYEACNKSLPFGGQCVNEMFKNIKESRYQEICLNYSQNICCLIECLLSSNEELRPSASEILNLGFVRARIQSFVHENKHYADGLGKSRFQELMNRSP